MPPQKTFSNWRVVFYLKKELKTGKIKVLNIKLMEK
jgi:hypothetical protein